MSQNINFTWFDLPFLAYAGAALPPDRWEPWSDYAVDTYGGQNPFTAGGQGFNGTWFASPSSEGIQATERWNYDAGTLGQDIGTSSLNENDIGFDGTWYGQDSDAYFTGVERWSYTTGTLYDDLSGTILDAVDGFTGTWFAGDLDYHAQESFDSYGTSDGTYGGTEVVNMDGGYSSQDFGPWNSGDSWHLGEGTWAPLGPVLLLDTGSSFDGETSGTIDTWADFSGSGHDFIQPSAGLGPPIDLANALNGHPVLHFGTHRLEALDFIKDYGQGELFCVARNDSDPAVAPTNGAWFQFTNNTQGASHHPWDGDQLVYENMWATTRVSFNPTTNLANWLIYNVKFNQYRRIVTINGTETPYSNTAVYQTSSDSGTYYIGAGYDGSYYYMKGYLAHIRVYERVLSPSERGLVMAELRDRFGL